MISYIGANKHHRQRKFVRRSTKRSVVQSTCKMSRGWMMRRELRGESLVGRVALATMARSIEGTRTDLGFQFLTNYQSAFAYPKKAPISYQILVHSVVTCGLFLDHRRVVSFYKRNESAALQRSFPYLGCQFLTNYKMIYIL